MSPIHLLGVSHRTADVAFRESLALAPARLEEAYRVLRERAGATEALLLSTCNRFEAYVTSPATPASLLEALAAFLGLPSSQLAARAFQHSDADAVRHAFEVVSGLDALALGETQVLGQAKEAYALAHRLGMAGPTLHPLFQQAFAAAKRVHTETAVGQRRISVSSVAVDLAARVFQDLSDHAALVIGAGETSALTVKHLKEQGLRRLTVANRTLARAEELAREAGGKAVPLEALAGILHEADIVIASAGAEGPLVTPEMVREALGRRRQRPLVLIDIAVPRNVDPRVRDMENVYAYDIDALQGIVAENLQARAEELADCRNILDGAVADFLHAHTLRGDVQPLITAFRDRLHALKSAELERLAPRLDPAVRAEVEQAMDRLVNKILHPPMETLREETRVGNGTEVLQALRRLFRLPS